MRRIGPRRDNAGNVMKDPATEPAPAGPEEPLSRSELAPEKPKGVGWGWRLALFLWVSSFVFLFLYELLMTLFHGGK